MKNKRNKILVDAFLECIPETKRLVGILMDILDLNKESVYRRLRSEVPFTFDEIYIIAHHLGISLDRIIGVGNKETVPFDFHMHKSTDPVSIYSEILNMNLGLFAKVNGASTARVDLILNRLPFAYTLPFENLAKFYYYKWYYHTQNVPSNFYFKDFVVPEQIKEIQKKHVDDNAILGCDITILMDNNLFLSMIKEINYFVNRGLITESEQTQFQRELLQCVDLIENVAKNGVNKGGVTINTYISAVDLEPNYVYIEYDDKACIHYWTSSAEIFSSCDTEMCERQKVWIQSLKRYTTLITRCNAHWRTEYFDKQRMYVRKKLSPSANQPDNQVITEEPLST
ncbi:hypothetical protein D0T84_13005 [Dysgonomonas sp. 521]|uniref:hypothetical protein n=1 Tax=Dysgonomonas sp. 521 TaxID=2302932 RepID=UPI0013D48483|nr:hypothetical protein [Dysgonomonas sp. 521]NDV95822.1 hypothetical protein [Dysgonomonas sp. 521]